MLSVPLALGAAAALAVAASAGTSPRAQAATRADLPTAAGRASHPGQPSQARTGRAALLSAELVAGSWRKLPAAAAGEPPTQALTVWTGSKMIIYGIRVTPSGFRRFNIAYRPRPAPGSSSRAVPSRTSATTPMAATWWRAATGRPSVQHRSSTGGGGSCHQHRRTSTATLEPVRTEEVAGDPSMGFNAHRDRDVQNRLIARAHLRRRDDGQPHVFGREDVGKCSGPASEVLAWCGRKVGDRVPA